MASRCFHGVVLLLLTALTHSRCYAADTTGMVFLPTDSFFMGSYLPSAHNDQGPRRRVAVKGFLIDKHEVTRKQFAQFPGKAGTPGDTCPLCPASSVTWYEARSYCRSRGKRLPTEAEWEYACGAGSRSPRPWNTLRDSLDRYAWYARNSGGRPRKAGTRLPNEFGLHDMIGNVWEWCADRYARDYSGGTGEYSAADYRVIRGGSWREGREILGTPLRDRCAPTARHAFIGFRCAMDAPPGAGTTEPGAGDK